MCAKYIGVITPKNALVWSTLNLKWLKENMLTFPIGPTPQQLTTHCRAYMLGLISGVLMLDKSGKRVYLMYLPMLADLEQVRWYKWGSTYLYKEMCRAIYPSPKKIGGCTVLLQSLAWYHMPFIQPRAERQPSYPFATRKIKISHLNKDHFWSNIKH